MPRKRLTADEEIERAERDARIIQCRRDGWTWSEIAADTNLSMSRCHQLFQQYRAQIPQSERDSWIQEELDLLARGIRKLLDLVSDERRAEDGRLLVSAHVKVEAHKELRQHSESRRTLLGTDSPKKREVEIIDSTSCDARLEAEISELENELRAADAVRRDQ